MDIKMVWTIECQHCAFENRSISSLSYLHDQSKYKGALTLLHSERPKLYTILAFLSAIGLTLCMDTSPREITHPGVLIFLLSGAFLKGKKGILLSKSSD